APRPGRRPPTAQPGPPALPHPRPPPTLPPPPRRPPPPAPLFPYTTLFRSRRTRREHPRARQHHDPRVAIATVRPARAQNRDVARTEAHTPERPAQSNHACRKVLGTIDANARERKRRVTQRAHVRTVRHLDA